MLSILETQKRAETALAAVEDVVNCRYLDDKVKGGLLVVESVLKSVVHELSYKVAEYVNVIR